MAKTFSARRALIAATAVAAVVLAVSTSGAHAAGRLDGSTGQGTVFFPNPVTQLGNENLPDNKDADDPVFGPAYKVVTLSELDGSGTLTGRWVTVKSKTGTPARADANGNFPAYHRDS